LFISNNVYHKACIVYLCTPLNLCALGGSATWCIKPDGCTSHRW